MDLRRLAALSLLLISMSISGCASKDVVNEKKNDLIYEDSISPNEQYVCHEGDIVNYMIEIYQENDATLFIQAKSNSQFFEPLSYEFYVNKSFSKDDIMIEWTTLMGSPKTSRENQLCIALIKIKGHDEVIKINFCNRGIEMIENVLSK